jgi:lysophospholipase L1-like esterase
MTNAHPNHPWTRYVALGDSFTEGIGDPEPESVGGNRGWADRLAEVLSDGQPDFSYANLAVRGKILSQISGE